MTGKGRGKGENVSLKKKKVRKVWWIIFMVLIFIGLLAFLTYEKGSEEVRCDFADCLFESKGKYWFHLLGYKEECSLVDLSKECHECSRKFLGFDLEKYNICKH